MAVHDGHRDRVRTKLKSMGTDAFLPHELLEYLLFHCVPYKDTNPIAHMLLDKAGGMEGVFSLSEEEVSSVPHLGKYAWRFLQLLREIAERSTAPLSETEAFDSYDALVGLAIQLVDAGNTEGTWLALFNNRYSLLSTHFLLRESYTSGAFHVSQVIEPALKESASMAALITIHTGRGVHASLYERQVSDRIKGSLALLGIKLLDHLIISDSVCCSALETPLARAQGRFAYLRFCSDDMRETSDARETTPPDGEEVPHAP